jgi:hypothetical protein
MREAHARLHQPVIAAGSPPHVIQPRNSQYCLGSKTLKPFKPSPKNAYMTSPYLPLEGYPTNMEIHTREPQIFEVCVVLNELIRLVQLKYTVEERHSAEYIEAT